jgi:hypothetical protein
MHHLPPLRAALLALLAILATAALAPAVGAVHAPGAAQTSPPSPNAGSPAAVATAYLQARAGGALRPARLRSLRALCVPGSALARREAAIALGARRLAGALGHRLAGVQCAVRVGGVSIDETAGTATVTAHAMTTTTWLNAKGRPSTEGEGLDHVIVLIDDAGVWRVGRDDYASDLTPRLLEAGGAARHAVLAAARRLERRARHDLVPGQNGAAILSGDAAQAAGGGRRGYVAVLTFDRAAAAAYADKYALSYNSTYTHFSADCANFGSQVMFAGGYPKFGSSYESGWWYDKNGTSSPGDDDYSHAWIACIPQQDAWNLKYTNVAASIGDVGKGDYVYYDWTGNGTWDHVAELVGSNSAGQKVVDAHTTDHYHVYWKLGTSSAHYRFVRTKPSIIV